MEEKIRFYPDQIVPLFLTSITFLFVWLIYHGEIFLLNSLVINRQPIFSQLRWGDFLLGLTIYLKTAIDFAIFVGSLMDRHPGWKNRIMIEIGTALGNALGTMGVLLVWDLFREVRFLMAGMILLAALVLLRLAENGLDHVKDVEGEYVFSIFGFVRWFEAGLEKVNRTIAPVLNILVPQLKTKEKAKTYKQLFFLSFLIPFVLGLDDFAGYISLFNLLNVYGFGVGVLFGHMILNIFLFLSPKKTIRAVKNPVVSFLGSMAFVGIAIWGLIEVARLIGV